MPRKNQRRTRSATSLRRPSQRQPITDAQDKRYSLMRRAGVMQEQIRAKLAEKGITVSRASIGAVILNKFVNDDIIDTFCELTGTSRAEAWPDVPPLEEGAARRTDDGA